MYRKAKHIERLLCSRGHFVMRGLRMDRNFDGKLRPKSPKFKYSNFDSRSTCCKCVQVAEYSMNVQGHVCGRLYACPIFNNQEVEL